MAMRLLTLASSLALALGCDDVLCGKIPTKEIAPGVHMPMAGLGTWLYNDTRAGKAAKMALDMGYTHIDTAYDYNNSIGIGKALAASDRKRGSYFITTKVEGGLSYAKTMAEAEENLKNLGVSYVDLLLLHFPDTMSATPAGNATTRQAQWSAMEDFYNAGKAKAIGVSHYCSRQMEDILAVATVTPAVNQVQFHVGMGTSVPNATDDRKWDNAHGITYESFSPLCGPCKTFELINGTMVTDIGKKYGKTGAQVSLKWIVQQGIPVIPKTDDAKHMAENVDLFDWTLSDEDMGTLTASLTPPVAGNSPTDSGDCGLS